MYEKYECEMFTTYVMSATMEHALVWKGKNTSIVVDISGQIYTSN